MKFVGPGSAHSVLTGVTETRRPHIPNLYEIRRVFNMGELRTFVDFSSESMNIWATRTLPTDLEVYNEAIGEGAGIRYVRLNLGEVVYADHNAVLVLNEFRLQLGLKGVTLHLCERSPLVKAMLHIFGMLKDFSSEHSDIAYEAPATARKSFFDLIRSTVYEKSLAAAARVSRLVAGVGTAAPVSTESGNRGRIRKEPSCRNEGVYQAGRRVVSVGDPIVLETEPLDSLPAAGCDPECGEQRHPQHQATGARDAALAKRRPSGWTINDRQTGWRVLKARNTTRQRVAGQSNGADKTSAPAA
jgi:anti-anti-sigma regulatory factor